MMHANPVPSVLATGVSNTGILVPLYVYPSGGQWDAIVSAVEHNPSVTFQVVINPGDGPGSSTPGYNTDWISSVASLKLHDNVETYGYVHTSYGDATAEEVGGNITIWDSWNNYAGSDISIDGIFFDETPGSSSAYMKALTRTAHSTLGSDTKIIFNPGVRTAITDTDYFSLADYVVVFESPASDYSPSVLSTNVPAGYASKASILIYDFEADDVDDNALGTWIEGMVNAGIGSFNIAGYNWEELGSTLGAANIETVSHLTSVKLISRSP